MRWFPVRSMSRMLVLLCLIVLMTAGCGGQEGEAGADQDSTKVGTTETENDETEESSEADSAKAEQKRKREKTTSVEVVEATLGNLVIPVVAEGRIRARHSVEIRTEISGRIDRVLVADGARVRKGQTLVRLDGREYEVAIAEARSRYLEALSRLMIEEEKLGQGSDNSEIDTQLLDLWNQEREGKITREERLEKERALELEGLREGTYRQDLVEARTGLAGARADEERGKLNLERTEIRAPFDGVIADLDADAGERVSAGQLLCNLIDDVDLEAEVGVLESDLRGLDVGRRALLALPALAETVDVKIDVINPVVDAQSRTCKVLIRFRNTDGRIRPGMFARALIAGQTFADRLLVPREAILTRDGRPLLFRVEDGHAKWVYVTLGLQNDRVVEIARAIQGGPLNPGDQVVVSDHLTLTDNARIDVKKVRDLGDPWTLADRMD